MCLLRGRMPEKGGGGKGPFVVEKTSIDKRFLFLI